MLRDSSEVERVWAYAACWMAIAAATASEALWNIAKAPSPRPLTRVPSWPRVRGRNEAVVVPAKLVRPVLAEAYPEFGRADQVGHEDRRRRSLRHHLTTRPPTAVARLPLTLASHRRDPVPGVGPSFQVEYHHLCSSGV